MEKLLTWVCVIIAFSFFGFIWRVVVSTFFAASKAVVGEGSFKDNFSTACFGMGEFQVRIVDKEFVDIKQTLKAKKLQIKGIYPVSEEKNTAIVISVIDETGGKKLPVLSSLEQFRENNTAAFQLIVPLGVAKPGFGFMDWTDSGGVIVDFLETAFSGTRNLIVFVRLIDLDNPPCIDLGFHTEERGIIWMDGLRFNLDVTNPGYKEELDNKKLAHNAIIKLAVYVALSDNSLDEEEGEVIKKWMSQTLYYYGEDYRESMKEAFNNSFKDAYSEYKSGKLSIENVCNILNDINTSSYKYEAAELCYDVIAADKKIENEEAAMIKNITELLNLDFNELQKIKDKRLVILDSEAQSTFSIEELIGIHPDMTEEQINTHLRKEFQKWNSRLNTLPEGEERANAQKMLEAIADIRNKHAA